ncbi:histidine kinase [Paenibacillus sp. MWE-103]|uniref:Histidine kinase n=1 Tax=Paenibacillus artemisiicola TaxID=1172618 RepID=A0ABS3WGI9_9BACL|nr:sensor histidine kinase [Paenibacillus artemisiicola]MBO7747452.1 histidine kinase [Paenibacillus artemisiicola]
MSRPRSKQPLFRHLYNRTLVYILCSTLAVTVPMLVMLSNYSMEETKKSNADVMTLMNNKLDSFFHSVETTEFTFATDIDFIIPLTLYYKLPHYDDGKTTVAFREASQALLNMTLFQTGLEFIVLGKEGPLNISSSPEVVNGAFLPERAAWYGKVTADTGHSHILFDNKRDYYLSADNAVSVVKPIGDMQSGEPIAFIVIDIAYARLTDMIEETHPSIPLTIKDPSGRVLFSNMNAKEAAAPEGRSVIGQRSGYTGITVTSYVTKPWFIAQIGRIVTICLIIMAFYLLAVFVILSVSTKRFAKPIYLLMNDMKQVVKGDFEVTADYRGRIAELHDLYGSFNRLVSGMKRLIHENYETSLLKTQAELEALQRTINPHFLYNALETISSQAIVDGSPSASVMCQKLGALFAYSLQENDLVTLERELGQLKDYLYIAENSFYYRNVEVRFAIDPATHGQLIPKMTLQPIVENCFKHGFGDRGGADFSRIVISSALSGGRVVVSVADNGRGLSPEQLARLRDGLGKPGGRGGSGVRIGLRHVGERYRLYYGGGEPLLTIRSLPGEGTTVTLALQDNRRERSENHA